MKPQWVSGDSGKWWPGFILNVIYILFYQDISLQLSAEWACECLQCIGYHQIGLQIYLLDTRV